VLLSYVQSVPSDYLAECLETNVVSPLTPTFCCVVWTSHRHSRAFVWPPSCWHGIRWPMTCQEMLVVSGRQGWCSWRRQSVVLSQVRFRCLLSL